MANVTLKVYPRYFAMIDKFRKTLEVRLSSVAMDRVSAGDTITFQMNDCRKGQGPKVTRRVACVRRYATFAEVARHENIGQIDCERTPAQLLAQARNMFRSRQNRVPEVLVFQLVAA